MGLRGGRVRDALRALADDPSESHVFNEMWPEICSEETTYDAAYAAAPYLVSFAEQMPTGDDLEYLIVLGLIATYAEQIPGDLEPAYRRALTRAQTLVLERLSECPVDHNLRYLLAAVAAFRGRTDLADVLGNLDAIQEPCPSCATVVFPTELQQVIERDQGGAFA
jgi:hypothetical protein